MPAAPPSKGDVKAAAKHGVIVTNTPEVLSDATAETTILLMLGAARRASEGERLVRSGGWKDWSPAFMVGVAVTGKRLGILGMGRIGQQVAKRAAGFDLVVHYHNRRKLDSALEFGARYEPDFDAFLGACPRVTLSVAFHRAAAAEQPVAAPNLGHSTFYNQFVEPKGAEALTVPAVAPSPSPTTRARATSCASPARWCACCSARAKWIGACVVGVRRSGLLARCERSAA